MTVGKDQVVWEALLEQVRYLTVATKHQQYRVSAEINERVANDDTYYDDDDDDGDANVQGGRNGAAGFDKATADEAGEWRLMLNIQVCEAWMRWLVVIDGDAPEMAPDLIPVDCLDDKATEEFDVYDTYTMAELTSLRSWDLLHKKESLLNLALNLRAICRQRHVKKLRALGVDSVAVRNFEAFAVLGLHESVELLVDKNEGVKMCFPLWPLPGSSSTTTAVKAEGSAIDDSGSSSASQQEKGAPIIQQTPAASSSSPPAPPSSSSSSSSSQSSSSSPPPATTVVASSSLSSSGSADDSGSGSGSAKIDYEKLGSAVASGIAALAIEERHTEEGEGGGGVGEAEETKKNGVPAAGGGGDSGGGGGGGGGAGDSGADGKKGSESSNGDGGTPMDNDPVRQEKARKGSSTSSSAPITATTPLISSTPPSRSASPTPSGMMTGTGSGAIAVAVKMEVDNGSSSNGKNGGNAKEVDCDGPWLGGGGEVVRVRLEINRWEETPEVILIFPTCMETTRKGIPKIQWPAGGDVSEWGEAAREAIARPWRLRKLLIQQLAELGTVLEYDAVDYSSIHLFCRLKSGNKQVLRILKVELTYNFPDKCPLMSFHEVIGQTRQELHPEQYKYSPRWHPKRMAFQLFQHATDALAELLGGP